MKDYALLRTPLLGKLLRDVAVARFTRTLGTLVSAGLPILQSLRITKDTLGNAVLMNAIEEVEEKVTTGQSLAEPLERCGFFPPLLIQIVNIGEKSGRLESMLLHAATAFDRPSRMPAATDCQASEARNSAILSLPAFSASRNFARFFGA